MAALSLSLISQVRQFRSLRGFAESKVSPKFRETIKIEEFTVLLSSVKSGHFSRAKVSPVSIRPGGRFWREKTGSGLSQVSDSSMMSSSNSFVIDLSKSILFEKECQFRGEILMGEEKSKDAFLLD